LKITDVNTYIVPPEVSVTSWVNGDPWVLVEVNTDAGISGWGQCYTLYDREHAIADKAQDLASRMDGTNPFAINSFIMSAKDEIKGSRNGLEASAAAAGIEIALWDIVGKALDAPVHHLLGGPCKDRIRLYANCWSNIIRSPEELASFAEKLVQRGFGAVKIYPFLYDVSVAHGIACLSAVRETVGPDVLIFVDMLETMPAGDSTVIFEALHRHGVSWLEDPAPANDIDTLAAIRRQSNLQVVVGEELYTNRDFVRLCEHGAASILNPEVTVLGILGVKEIAAVAEAYSMDIAVHNSNTMTIGLAAALQAAAVTPNSRWVEFFPTLEVGSNFFSRFPFELDEDGFIPVPHEPGLGVAVDKTVLGPMEYNPDSYD
jgi:galactonate dehydratase